MKALGFRCAEGSSRFRGLVPVSAFSDTPALFFETATFRLAALRPFVFFLWAPFSAILRRSLQDGLIYTPIAR